MTCRRIRTLFPLVLILVMQTASAEVVRFEIRTREPFADGEKFGNVGAYERIIGTVHYAIDPKLRQNAEIVDLQFAPRAVDGRVHFQGDLFILTPADPAKAAGVALYDVNNRGNKLALRFFNSSAGGNDPKSAADAGNGFLMRQGITVVWSGWDGELLPAENRLRLVCPVARDGDKSITGPVRCEFIPTSADQRMLVVNWEQHGSYRPTARGVETASLTVRERPGDAREFLSREQWKLHVTPIGDSPSQLPKVEVEIPGGMKQGYIYELIYEAQDPLVHGVCFAGVRDLISSFRQGSGIANPLLKDGKPYIRRAHGFGVSQSGRFLREFTYSGFNENESGGKVFDGIIPHVSGSGLGSFNHRFAQPTRHCNQHDHHDYPADRFPFTYATQTDPLSGKTDGILRRSVQTRTSPLVFHTQSAAEYWTRSGSLSHTDPLGKVDAEIPDTIRVYLFGGTQHGPSGYPPAKGVGQTLANPGDYKPFLRALLVSLDRWAEGKSKPPASVYATIAGGTLVPWDQKTTGFPNIPGVRYPTVIQQPPLLDFGPRWETQRIADLQPPRIAGEYRVLVPKCDVDGNEIGCLSPPEVAVPVATYTGWNLRRQDAGAENELVSLTGSFIPFPGTKAEREKTGDPRQSVAERYGSLDEYLRRLRAACVKLEQGGYLLAEDVERTVEIHRERVAPLFVQSAKAAQN